MKIDIKTDEQLRGPSLASKRARTAFKLARALIKQMSDAGAAYDRTMSPPDRVRLLGMVKANLKVLKEAAEVYPWLGLDNLAEVERTISAQEGVHLANGWYGPAPDKWSWPAA